MLSKSLFGPPLENAEESSNDGGDPAVDRGAADHEAEINDALGEEAVDHEDRTDEPEPGRERVGPVLYDEQDGGRVAAAACR